MTSPIQLTDIDPTTLQVLSTVAVPTNQVVTSFSSKSELGLQLTKDAAGNHLVFVGYGLAGVGALASKPGQEGCGRDQLAVLPALLSRIARVAGGNAAAFRIPQDRGPANARPRAARTRTREWPRPPQGQEGMVNPAGSREKAQTRNDRPWLVDLRGVGAFVV